MFENLVQQRIDQRRIVTRSHDADRKAGTINSQLLRNSEAHGETVLCARPPGGAQPLFWAITDQLTELRH